jgi:hypothetical protein
MFRVEVAGIIGILKRADHVTLARDALRVQPWRGDDGDPATGAAGHLRGQRPWEREP